MSTSCYDFIYTPVGDPTVETLVANLRANNVGRVIPLASTRGFTDPATADAWMYANPRQVGGEERERGGGGSTRTCLGPYDAKLRPLPLTSATPSALITTTHPSPLACRC